MNLEALLRILDAAGITLTLGVDGTTFHAAPSTALTPALCTLLRAHKPALLAALQARTWDDAAARATLEAMVGAVRVWWAVADIAGKAAGRVVLDFAVQAIRRQDMVALQDAHVWLEEAYAWWADQLWPDVPTDTPAQQWARSAEAYDNLPELAVA